MKQLIKILILSLFFLTAAPSVSDAISLSLGGKTWFAWWDPSFKNSPARDLVIKKKNVISPDFLYGPALSLGLPEGFNLSAMFLTGEFTAKRKEMMTYGAQLMPANYSSTIRRYDVDTSLGYNVTGFFKIYLGFKYIHYQYKIFKYIFYPFSIASVSIEDDKKKHSGYSPALGLQFSAPIAGGLYFIFSLSMMYEFSVIRTNMKSVLFSPQGGQISLIAPDTNRSRFGRLGGNTRAAFAYIIPKINTVVSAGFRYQLFKGIYSLEDVEPEWKSYDHCYGINISVIYIIKFPAKDKKAGAGTKL